MPAADIPKQIYLSIRLCREVMTKSGRHRAVLHSRAASAGSGNFALQRHLGLNSELDARSASHDDAESCHMSSRQSIYVYCVPQPRYT